MKKVENAEQKLVMNEEIAKQIAQFQKESLPPNVFDATGNIHVAAMVDAFEELNFRLSAFIRAYMGKDVDAKSVIKRARILQEHCTDFGSMLSVYCNHHESLNDKTV